MMPNVLHSEIWYVTKNISFENELPHKGLCHSFGSSSCLHGWYKFTLILSLSRLLLICILTSWGKCPLCTSHCWWQNFFLGNAELIWQEGTFLCACATGSLSPHGRATALLFGRNEVHFSSNGQSHSVSIRKKITCAEDNVSEFAVTDRSLGSIVEVISHCISFNLNNSHEMSWYIRKYPPTGIAAFIAVHWPAKVWPRWLTKL